MVIFSHFTVGIWKPALINAIMLQKRPKFVHKIDKMQKFAAGDRVFAPKHPPSMMPSADLQLIFPSAVLHPEVYSQVFLISL